jgi:hypothetical protein
MQHQRNFLTTKHIIQIARIKVMKHMLQGLYLLQHVWKGVPVIMRQLVPELRWDYSFEIFDL